MSKLYLFTQPSCANCPAVKAILEEEGIAFEEIDAREISVDMTMQLLRNGIVIYWTPRIVKEEDGKFKMISLNDVISDNYRDRNF